MPTPTRTNFNFAGWWTAPAGGTQVLPTATAITRNIELFARWTEIVRIVTLNPNGGTINPNTINVASGQPIGTLPPPNRAGHTFAGWWTAAGNNATRVDASRIITANITLFARWNITITFNSNGGIAVPNRTLISGSTFGELPPTTRGDFVFGGWWNSPTGGTQINHNTVLNGNITLFARWHAVVSFNPNGGNVVNPSTRTVLVGTAIGNLPNTSRSGHTFAGWWTGQTGGTQVLRDTIINSGIALFARWNQNIIVTFDANGGTPATQQRTVQNGQSLGNLFPANPTRNGHTFGGWFIQPSLITQMLASTIITGNINLSARWRFTITFNGNGGQTPNPLILTSGITVGELPRPTKDNHRFLGWATSQSNTNVLPDGLLIEGNATLWARWEQIQLQLLVTLQNLRDFGWRANLTDTYVQRLNNALRHYGVTNIRSIRLFMATCAHESGLGQWRIENLPLPSWTQYSIHERGAGYIQLTWRNTHLRFLQSVNDNFNGNNTAEYIANNYVWEAAVWFWAVGPYGSNLRPSVRPNPNNLNNFAITHGDSLRIFILTQYAVNGWGNVDNRQPPSDEATLAILNGAGIRIENNSLNVDGFGSFRLPIGWADRYNNYNNALNSFR